ncbi:MAG: hypothetical protein LBK29_04515 [Oscillospiraceae bacterium]|nr:hypothetical protein [Oscillospiraceae bacterium]
MGDWIFSCLRFAPEAKILIALNNHGSSGSSESITFEDARSQLELNHPKFPVFRVDPSKHNGCVELR